MVAKMRGRFLPKDYQLSLYRKMQNLRQRGLIVREYTEEFYKVNLRAGYIEDTSEKTTRYINGLRMDIQEEMSMLSPSVMEEAYQYALKAEEKISKKQVFGRGKGVAKGRGQIPGTGKGVYNPIFWLLPFACWHILHLFTNFSTADLILGQK